MRLGTVCTMLGLVAGNALGAQQAGANDVAATVRKGFDDVIASVSKSAEMVPADKYGYKPVAPVRSFGQLIAHIADGNNYFCARASGRDVEWSDAVEKGSTDKATVTQKLKQSVDACASAYGGSGRAAPNIENLSHVNLHYGNVITYLRMMGMVPPSS